MKKYICGIFAALAIAVVIAPEQKAEAQVVYSNRCCDSWNVIRCVQDNFTPVGYPCYCYGQGYGHTC
jgi:hypothetical protein